MCSTDLVGQPTNCDDWTYDVFHRQIQLFFKKAFCCIVPGKVDDLRWTRIVKERPPIYVGAVKNAMGDPVCQCTISCNYSYLSDSMGSRRAAFQAGHRPKPTPMKTLAKKPAKGAQSGT
jgi:hypothetical protein